jgi:pilus assembly protein CpaE
VVVQSLPAPVALAPTTHRKPEPPRIVDSGRNPAAPIREARPEARVETCAAPIDEGVTVTVVDTDPVVRAVLRDHVKSLHIDAVAHDSVTELTRAPGPLQPTVLVVGPTDSPDMVIEHVKTFLMSRPDSGAVMLVFDPTAEIVRSAFHAGVDDVVAVNADDVELLGAVSRSVSRVRARLETSRPPASPAPLPALGPPGRVVTVFGTKGGTGKSVVAVNLAVALARQAIGAVALVDANLQFGDVAIMLQLRPEHTIAEAVAAGDLLDGDLLGDLLLRHKPSGLLVLAAPSDPVSGDRVGRAELANVLGILRERCAWVVVDTSPRMDESTLTALQVADNILIVTNLDVMSLKNARLGLQTLDALGIAQAKVKLVVNQESTPAGLSQTDAERAMHLKVAVTLPRDLAVAESVNRGVPVMLSTPTSKFALGITDLTQSLSARSSFATEATASQPRLHTAFR